MNQELDKLLKKVGKESRSPGEALTAADLAEAAAWLEGRLDARERQFFEEKAVQSPALLTLLADVAIAGHRAEEQPACMPDTLKEKILNEVAKGRRATLVQLVIDRAGEMMQWVSGGGGMEQLSLEPVRGGRFDSFYRIQLQEIEIQVATDCRKDGRFDIWLKARPERSEVRRCQWQLWQDQCMLESQMNDTGEGVFTGFPIGRYQFVLQIADREVGQIDLMLRENGNE